MVESRLRLCWCSLHNSLHFSVCLTFFHDDILDKRNAGTVGEGALGCGDQEHGLYSSKLCDLFEPMLPSSVKWVQQY